MGFLVSHGFFDHRENGKEKTGRNGQGTYHIPIDAAALQQVGVVPLLEDAAFAEDEDDVGVLNGGEAVRDDDHGAAAGGALKGSLHEPLALRVETARRLVQQQHARPPDQRPRDREPLLLSARQRDTPRAAGGGLVRVLERGEERQLTPRCCSRRAARR